LQPKFINTSPLNNKPYLNFDGSDNLRSNNNFSLTNCTIFIVATQNSGETDFCRLLDHGYNTGFWIGRSGTNVGGGFYELSAPFGNFKSVTNDVPFILSLNRSGATTTYQLNTQTFPIPTRTTLSSATISNKIFIGSTITSSDFGKKNIYEIIIYNSSLSSSDRQSVENYLRNKYAPPLSLGPDINVSNDFCAVNINAPTGFSNLLWSTGSTSSSISVSQPGEYWLQGTDVFGFTSTDTIVVTYPTIPQPTFNGICVNEAMTWNADMGPGYTYLWSTGETTPSINISTAGIYSVQVTDPFGCSKNSGNYLFNIDTYSQTTWLGNDTTLCAGNLIALQMGGFETISYTWPDGSAGPNYAVDTTGNYFLESENYNGCVAQDTIHITVSGTAPAANYSLNNECLGTAADFLDLSVPAGADPINSWTWDMGDGNILSGQNPSHVYTTAGSFPVELYVESQGGCGANFTDTIIIYANPSAAYTYTGHCAEYSIQFTDESVDGSVPITNYLWNFDMPWTGAYNTSTISVPNRIFDTEGSYDVFFKVTDANSCVDSVTQTVVIDPTPQADFAFNDGCANTAIQFTNTSVTQPSSTYLYTFPDNSTSILPNPSKAFPFYGLQTVSLQVTNTFGCVGTIDYDIVIHPNPEPLMDLGPYCKGTYVEANDASTIPVGSIDSSVWIFNSVDTLSGGTIYYLIDAIGQQEVELISFSDQGCVSSVSQFIDVTTVLDASFTVGSVGAVGDAISFENTTIGTTVGLWNFGDGTFSTDFSPEHEYSEVFLDSTVEVYLIAMNTTGCADTAYQTISLQRANIDLELETMYLQKQNDWYIVGVKMTNTGTVKLGTIHLNIEAPNGILFNETWTGILKPLEDSIYVFTAQPTAIYSDQDEEDAFICVNGLAYDLNGQVETYLENNTTCKNVEGENVVLLPIYPNPATENVTFEVLVTVDSELSLVLYDARGRAVKTIIPQQTLSAGFYTYPINIEDIAEGSYFVRLKSETGEVMEKVVIGD
jgi:PKD repeat protein